MADKGEGPSLGEKIVIPSLKKQESLFKKSLMGQDAAIHDFALVYTSLLSGVRATHQGPHDSLFLAGPSGVGKTEMTLTLAKLLTETNGEGADGKVIVINGGEFQQDHTLSRLIGAPPGYVGSKGADGYINPLLSTQNLKDHQIRFKSKNGQIKTTSIILIDEAEKACDAFHKVFLSVLDKGKIQMGDNSEVDLSNTVVLFTSNIGNQEIEDAIKNGSVDITNQEAKKEMVDKAIGRRFPPELRGRIRKIVIFEHLKEDVIVEIAKKQANEIYVSFIENGTKFNLSVTEEAFKWLAAKGYNTSEGARAMGKVIHEQISNTLMLINNEYGLNGKDVHIGVDGKDDPELDFYWGETKEGTNNWKATLPKEAPLLVPQPPKGEKVYSPKKRWGVFPENTQSLEKRIDFYTPLTVADLNNDLRNQYTDFEAVKNNPDVKKGDNPYEKNRQLYGIYKSLLLMRDRPYFRRIINTFFKSPRNPKETPLPRNLVFLLNVCAADMTKDYKKPEYSNIASQLPVEDVISYYNEHFAIDGNILEVHEYDDKDGSAEVFKKVTFKKMVGVELGGEYIGSYDPPVNNFVLASNLLKKLAPEYF